MKSPLVETAPPPVKQIKTIDDHVDGLNRVRLRFVEENTVMENSKPMRRPEVIVDFAVDDGMLSVCLKNIGDSSGYRVRTVFDKPFYGLNGDKCLSRMRVFREVAFMPPGKEFCQFVDMLARYAKRKEPMQLKATVSYRDRAGNRYQDVMAHDLRIYLELGQARLTSAREGG